MRAGTYRALPALPCCHPAGRVNSAAPAQDLGTLAAPRSQHSIEPQPLQLLDLFRSLTLIPTRSQHPVHHTAAGPRSCNRSSVAACADPLEEGRSVRPASKRAKLDVIPLGIPGRLRTCRTSNPRSASGRPDFLDPDPGRAGPDHPDLASSSPREVDDAIPDKGTSVCDSDSGLPAVRQVPDLEPSVECQSLVGRRHLVHVIDLAIGRLAPVVWVAVPAGGPDLGPSNARVNGRRQLYILRAGTAPAGGRQDCCGKAQDQRRDGSRPAAPATAGALGRVC